jgi:putative acetyltransferase
MNEVAEGVSTTPAAARLAKNLGLDLPLISTMDSILAGRMNAREAMVYVMNLPIGFETHSAISNYYTNSILGAQEQKLSESLLTVVPAKTSDIPSFIRVIGHTFVEYDWVWNPKVEVPDLFQFEKSYLHDKAAFWVVKDGDDEVVGGVGVDIPGGDAPQVAELHRLYLLAKARGQKLGTQLTLRALHWAKGKGCKKLIAWTDTRFLSAHRMYEGAGFKKTGKRKLEGDVNDAFEFGFELLIVQQTPEATFSEALMEL